MWSRVFVWLVWFMIVGGTWCLPCGAATLEPLLPDHQPPSMGSRIDVWPGNRAVSPPAVVYPYPYVYIYPDSYTSSGLPTAPPYGYVRLEVRPPEAEIYLDGNLIGRGQDFTGPAVVSVLPGGHVVELRWQNSGTQIRLFVRQGETIAINRDLGPVNPTATTPAAKRWSTPSRVGGY
jgi:hypothetical protein